MAWNRRNKYNAKKTTLGGYTYDSKLEASEAQELEVRKLAGEVESFTRQHRLDLCVGGQRICMYKIDFRVELTDGSIEYIEVKGLATDVWRIKWKLTQAMFEELTEGETAVLILSKKDSRTTVLRNEAYLKSQE